MRVLVYIARHGKTDDSDKNIFRGNRNSKLNKQGFRDAYALQQFFKNKDFGNIYSSDMTRAIQTGHVIGEPHDKVPYVTHGLEPWRIGEITGQDKTEYAPVMKHFIDNPDEPIPGGESRNEFEQGRIRPLLVEAMLMGLEGPPPIVIGHSSIIHAGVHMINGEGPSDIAVKPGGVIQLYLDDDGAPAISAIYKKGKEDSSYDVNGKKQSPTS